ncbi:DUF3604 domain-containing protein [Rhodopseudomonas palustris]|uniref:DUF3604 domain-containing protein n=2 Tax=Rhodopseudomonas palustris TaxID=1076 RepID=A0A323UCC2_RHOPL|nr:DUF3604 domain-containing protein [Rhodopseudomonas palustris]
MNLHRPAHFDASQTSGSDMTTKLAPARTCHSVLANWMPEVTPVAAADAGSVTIDNTGPFVAGSYQRFTMTYTAGRYGIDDSGCLKICYRFASDMGRPQFTDPAAPNYVKVTASNGATLDVRFDYKQNTRPWDRTIYIKIVAGFMKEGDTIRIEFGSDPRGPGIRMQTFVDPEFGFRVLVDPIATYTFVDVPSVPVMPIVAGPAARWHAVLPTCRAIGDEFSLGIRADDMWGNPTTTRGVEQVQLLCRGAIDGLPQTVPFNPAAPATEITGLRANQAGRMSVDLVADGRTLTSSNLLVVEPELKLRPYWGDLHAQSGETIGSGSAHDYMTYARDCAFLDAIGHQGNDFQITGQFWEILNGLMRDWNEPGRFVTIPGYEWSGNTSLGGDRNVFYRTEDRVIHRSSHALVPERSDADTDCWDARALFEALEPKAADTVVWAHCGGRYADIKYAHHHALERSVEVHSSWGTFEWLAADAFENGYRVGIVANSDGHKGRPGYEPPGASMFGALGGLTCYWLPELTRDAMFDALQARHHYATTGSRMHMTVQSCFDQPVTVWTDDLRIAGARQAAATSVMMGDIVTGAPDTVEFDFCIEAASPILDVEIRRGTEVLEVIRPHTASPLGTRCRIEWSGAEYRGRARQTIWDGALKVAGAEITAFEPINFFNPDRPLRQVSPHELAWQSITTGNFAGVDLSLSSTDAVIEITTPLGTFKHTLAELTHEPVVHRLGKLGRELRLSREPDRYDQHALKLRRSIAMCVGDNPIWLRATFADGHQAWSSPIYIVRD